MLGPKTRATIGVWTLTTLPPQIFVTHNVHRVALPAPIAFRYLVINFNVFIDLARNRPLAGRVQFPLCLRFLRQRLGFIMTTLFQTAAITTVPAIDAPPAPKKRTLLPLLTVLFLISYALMTLLIVEQSATIESQRALIRELFRDSTELSSIKMKAQQAAQNSAAKAPATPSNQAPSTQAPSAHAPSTQAPSKQAPSSQAVPQKRTQNQPKSPFATPSRPASDIVDETRAVITI